MSSIATTTGTTPAETFFRVDDFIIQLREISGLKISKSAFLNGVRDGKFPQPTRLTPRRPVWKKSDIDSLIAAL